ncbi:MAG: type II secretion system major pseudopilin GspG [Desulfobacteraceae bacterium]|jgi:general secretion pathway protein G
MQSIFPPRKANNRGFTLIELMVVIVILGVLAGMIVPKIMDRPEQAKVTKAKMLMESIGTALDLYKLDVGTYPTTEQGLQALVEAPETDQETSNWRKGGYLDKGRVPKDPWNNDFVYLSPGANGDYDLTCLGGDRAPGGDGTNADINSWEL